MDTVATSDEPKPHVIFIPFPAQSHIKAMMKLAKLLHHKGLHITFLNTVSNHKRLLLSGGPHCLDSVPGFKFETIPDGSIDDVAAPQDMSQLCDFLKINFLDLFLDLVPRFETPLTCIISDGYMTFFNTLEAAERLRVPIMLYWTLAACGFMGIHLTHDLMKKGLIPLKDESCLTNGYLNTQINWIPGMKGICLKDLPEYVRATHSNEAYFKFYCITGQGLDRVSHMIIHTFDELEASLVKELTFMFPRVYTVGPLQLHLNQMTKDKETNKLNVSGYSLWKEEPKCIHWLQSREPNSVLYVNFGSLAHMSSQDMLEFGWGLVNSNHYFLWIIRPDLVSEGSIVLPSEFEQRVKNKGFLASWCSQEEVLNHPSIGGFLTHGGWGSIIESLSAGVPMMCWPHSGDQRTNCRQMCIEWEVGMEIGSNVKRDEVEKLVRELMEGEKGKKLKSKAMEWKKLAEIAVAPNGSSSLNIDKLVDEITMLSRK